eukprot:TRINITY_DN16424_c0_g1_i1.p1 TRINITY_DN16424_c0_g1~~TRINITY_DN16424_c0_g1_i1.p1  ORF type:complete len:125 (-),score=21.64 TRINITY_DN16424_c0_g1_i1:191-565(-)
MWQRCLFGGWTALHLFYTASAVRSVIDKGQQRPPRPVRRLKAIMNLGEHEMTPFDSAIEGLEHAVEECYDDMPWSGLKEVAINPEAFRRDFVKQVRDRARSPRKIHQGREMFCGPASFSFVLAC